MKKPCRRCNKPLAVGPSSQPNPTCLACRRIEPQRKRKPRPKKFCTGCGCTVRSARNPEPYCGQCNALRMAARRAARQPDLIERARLASAARTRARRTSAQAALTKAARGTTGKRRWTQGACNWCGEQFTSVGVQPSRWCSTRCDQRAKRQRRTTTTHGGTGWRWSDFMRMAATFSYCCAYCGTKPHRLDPDHVVPLARGGNDSLSNLLPTCLLCNSDKRDLLLIEWNADRTRRGLEPRTTQWRADDQRVWHLALPPATDRAA